MNVLLLRGGYPLAVILKHDRKKYYRVLQAADRGKPEPLVLFIAFGRELLPHDQCFLRMQRREGGAGRHTAAQAGIYREPAEELQVELMLERDRAVERDRDG